MVVHRIIVSVFRGPKMKKLLLLLCLAMLGFGLAAAQSRRVPPNSANDKSNRREPSPTPTPASTPDSQAETDLQIEADSGDVINVDTELVTIPVRILDRKNRFVGGLAQANFKVFEDNVEQEIAYFTNEAQPFTVALVLDMSYSATFKIDDIQSAAISFIDQLRPEDRVMVISFDEEVHMLSEATSDRRRIYRAIRSTRLATGTSLYEAVDLTMNSRLRSIKGRKAIVLFTDGVDTTSRTSHDLENLKDALELDALIYPIRYDTFADVQAIKNKSTITFPVPGSNPGSNPPMGTPGDKGTTAEEYKFAEEYLNKLAERTGGRIYLASTVGNLTSAFSKIASELREFYGLGYYPKEEGKPGKTRRIKVQVDQQNVAVRARDSYVIPKKTTVRSK